MDEQRQLPPYAYTLLLLGTALLLAWIVRSALNEQEGDAKPTDKVIAPLLASSSCASLVRECRAKAEVRFSECDEAIGRRKVGLALGEPLDAEGCSELSRGFDEMCGTGCRLDRNNLLIIPGTLVFEFSDRPDESGKCLARATQPITVRAKCSPVGSAEVGSR